MESFDGDEPNQLEGERLENLPAFDKQQAVYNWSTTPVPSWPSAHFACPLPMIPTPKSSDDNISFPPSMLFSFIESSL